MTGTQQVSINIKQREKGEMRAQVHTPDSWYSLERNFIFELAVHL